MAAIRAAQRNRTVLLLEKNAKPGSKILISGGGHCNLTHACDERGIATAFGPAGRFLHSALALLGPSALVDMFHAEGVPTRVEEGGKVFPASGRAADVLDALMRRFTCAGAELALREPARGIERAADGFQITTARRTVYARAVVVATGGKSYPGCGTTGDGYHWLASLGHTVHMPRPALVPLTTGDGWVRLLAGIALPDVLVRVIDSRDTAAVSTKKRGGPTEGVLAERRGAILFAHFGLSGPAVMDVSRAVTLHGPAEHLRLTVDFLPDAPSDGLDAAFHRAAAADGRKLATGLAPRPLPRRLAELLAAQAGVPAGRRAAELSKVERAEMVRWMKWAEIAIAGTRGFDHAEVTTGGIALNEVDSRTMQSKLIPGLYITGELLDLDGPIGGFNLQAAFSTGWQAGTSVAAAG